MTKISGARGGLNLLLDQIGSQAIVPKNSGSGNTAAFDSHLARVSQNGNGDSMAKDSNTAPSTSEQSDAAASGSQTQSVSSLLSAFTGDAAGSDGAAAAAGTDAGKAGSGLQPARTGEDKSAAKTNDPSGQDPSDAVSALIARLTGKIQSSQAETRGTIVKPPSSGQAPLPARTDDPVPVGTKAAKAAESAAVGSTAADNTADGAAATQMQSQAAAIGDPAKAGMQPPAQTISVAPSQVASDSKDAAQAAPSSGAASGAVPTGTGMLAASLSRRPSASDSKDADQPAPSSADPSAAAQTAMAMLAASLASQNTMTTQASRKLGPGPGSAPALAQSRALTSNAPSLRAAQADMAATSGLSSSSDASQAVTQKDRLNPFADSADTDDTSFDAIKMNVSSIHAETHLAPVPHLSPSGQIADFVALMAGSGSTGDASGAATASDPAASSPSPDTTGASIGQPSTSAVKTLTLSLEPESLGTVTVTMRLANSGLQLQLEAAKSETTSLIDKDKDNLSDKLQSLGYSVDSLVVKTAAAQAPRQDSSNDPTAAGQGQQQAGNDAPASGLSQNGGRNANDQSPAQAGRGAAGDVNQEAVSDPSTVRTIGDGVYV